MALNKKEEIRRLVFEACEAHDSRKPCDLPDPRDSARAFAFLVAEKIKLGERQIRRYVKFAIQDYAESLADEQPSILSKIEHRHSHDEAADLYSFWPPGARRPFTISGEHIRAMKRQYSNPPMGEGLTMNHVAQSWGLARDTFYFIKRELGWTKDQDEFTREEHETMTTPEMMRDREMRSRGDLHRASAKAQHDRVKEDAAKWRRFRESILEEVRGSLAAPVELGAAAPVERGEHLCVLSPSDLHIGKLGADDKPGNTYEAVISTTRQICRMAVDAGASRALLVLGNDWGHIDTPSRTTTRGTPQDSLSLRRVIRESVLTARDLVIEVARWFESVEISVVPSNHSKVGDFWMVEVLAAMFAGSSGIVANVSTSERQYYRFGASLIGLEHGDGAKESDLGAIMARERPRDWGETKFRYWHIGHMHHLRERDVGGAVVCMAPSLSTTDRWHSKNGYVLSQRANVGYLYDRDHGQIARYVWNYAP